MTRACRSYNLNLAAGGRLAHAKALSHLLSFFLFMQVYACLSRLPLPSSLPPSLLPDCLHPPPPPSVCVCVWACTVEESHLPIASLQDDNGSGRKEKQTLTAVAQSSAWRHAQHHLGALAFRGSGVPSSMPWRGRGSATRKPDDALESKLRAIRGRRRRRRRPGRHRSRGQRVPKALEAALHTRLLEETPVLALCVFKRGLALSIALPAQTGWQDVAPACVEDGGVAWGGENRADDFHGQELLACSWKWPRLQPPSAQGFVDLQPAVGARCATGAHVSRCYSLHACGIRLGTRDALHNQRNGRGRAMAVGPLEACVHEFGAALGQVVGRGELMRRYLHPPG